MTTPPTITLASASPRRQQLLSLTGWGIRLHPVSVDERPQAGEGGEALARRLALHKASEAARTAASTSLILAADTVVADGETLLGKPADAADAARMLERLRRKTHRVLTAVALSGRGPERPIVECCATEVPMRDYAADEIARYVRSGAPLDKAGAYGIQDNGFQPVHVDRMVGCYANVMGLPLCHVLRAMGRLGHRPTGDVPAACQRVNDFECKVYGEILREEA